MAVTLLGRVHRQENFFELNLKYLYYVGLWPSENLSKNQKFLYKFYEITLHVLSCIFLVLTGIGTYQNKNDTTMFLANLDKTLVAYHFVFKIIIFVYKRGDLKMLIDEMISAGDKIIESHKALMAQLVISLIVISTGIVTVFSGLAFYNGEMTIEAWMPFDPMKDRMNLFAAAQILAVTFLVPCSSRAFAMQGFVCSLIVYIRDQLIELQQRIRALEYKEEDGEILRENFKEIVKKHIRLISYSKSIEKIFQEYFLIQNLAITIELCFNAMMVTMVGLEQKTLAASFIAFLSVALLNAYLYCYLGNELIIQSEGIALAAYESSWISWPVDMQKNLLTLMTAARRPMKLTAGGMSWMSIQNYSQTLYNGYSIFAVLNDVVN